MHFVRVARRRRRFALSAVIVSLACAITTTSAHAGFVVFEAAGANAAAITPSRGAFHLLTVGGGTVAEAMASSVGSAERSIGTASPTHARTPTCCPRTSSTQPRPAKLVLSTPGSGFLSWQQRQKRGDAPVVWLSK